jgi:hypothetical protein
MGEFDDLPPPPEPPPTLPGRGAYLLAFSGVVLAGIFGGIIGWGVTDIGCEGDCAVATAAGTIIGAIVGAGGVAIVAVLVLRAMAEWDRHQQQVRESPANGTPVDEIPPRT